MKKIFLTVLVLMGTATQAVAQQAGAIDGGVGYTYLDQKTGHEFSAVTGLTYNFKNTSTDYQNGIDWHLDWGASQFLSKQFFIGAVGYFYQQITPDSGQAAFLGPFESARHRNWTANRFSISRWQSAGIPESQGLWRV